MAPAVRVIIIGKTVLIFNTSNAPITAKIGSTIALKEPKIKAFNLDELFPLNGREIAAPSGKFCIPIPKVSEIAAAILPLPYATPSTNPSGILWRVIDIKSIKFEVLLVILLKSLSHINNSIPPVIKLMEIIYQEGHNSIAGFKREKNDAEIIIPADNESIVFKRDLLIFLKNKTMADPKLVIKKVNNPAKKAWNKGFKLVKNVINYITIIWYAKYKKMGVLKTVILVLKIL